MIHVDQEYSREVECIYKGETYKVRDNGAVLRIPREGKPKRVKDDVWTFGDKIDRGYARFCGESVHRIVAVAFLGEPPTNQHVVDHIDTNRQNNRPENLRWLTKLENILLNPITRNKIEYWCGSVENFLEDPSQLRGHESEDKNFAWMRAVSREEAQNTMTSWVTFLSKPRQEISGKGNAIEEWIFGSNHIDDGLSKILDDFEPITQTETPELTSKKEIITPVIKNEPRTVPISKKEFMDAFQEICEAENWTYKKYYKGDLWKADFLITKDEQKIAISAYSSESAASKSVPQVDKGGVKECCLILAPKKRGYAKESTYLNLQRYGDEFKVSVADRQLSLVDFVKMFMDGKIQHLTRAKITAVDVLFEQTNCYFCHAPHHVFFVRYLVDENGVKHDLAYIENEYDDENMNLPNLRFGDEILNLVKNFIAEHPEKGFVMGEVKERYSKTMDESYMSFGCPKCDGIVGSWYLNDMEMDVIYETDEKRMNRMMLKTPFEIPVDVWVVEEYKAKN